MPQALLPKRLLSKQPMEIGEWKLILNQHHHAGEKQSLEKWRLLELGPDAQHRVQGVQRFGVWTSLAGQHVEGHIGAVTPIEINDALVGIVLAEEAVLHQVAQSPEAQIMVGFEDPHA